MADLDIDELRQEFADDTAEWTDIRKEAAIDMRYASGDPWDPKDRQAREKAGRPCLSLDELGQYVNQVVNEVRSNKRAVKFSPVGNGANDKTAEFYADKMREIEYRSKAQIAYTTAFENAVQRGYGFCRVNMRYEHPRAVYQDLWIDPVHNPNTVTPDPYALMPDLSDMKRCWVREPWRIEDFNKRWPKHEIKGRQITDLARDIPSWITHRQVWVSELWKVTTTQRKLLIVDVGPDREPRGFFEDELDAGVPGTVIAERDTEDRSVYQCLTNGVDILEQTQWPGKYIPIIGCLGKVMFVEESGGSSRQILSMIRLARDPYMLYCYYRTAEAEQVGMSTKFPYFVRKGSLAPDQLLALQRSTHEPVAAIEVEAMIEGMGGQPPEMPVRNPFEPAIQALEVGAEGARRAIQAAMGQTPLPTQAQRRNEKSGVALKHIEETGQRGSFHFIDHYLDMITQVGVVVEDLMDKVYDTARHVGIRRANESAEIVRINDGSPGSISTKGDHIVTVSTGPSFESEREAASDFADTLASISPEIFAVLGPLIVKLKNLGPIGDEMVELLEAMQPPPVQELRKAKEQQGQQASPEQAQAELVQVKAQLQQVMQAAQEMQQALETEQAKQQATLMKAQMDAETELAKAKLQEATKLAIAKLQALTKPEIEAENEVVQSEVEHQHTLEQIEVEHAHAMELEEAKAKTALAQLQQQALVQGVQGEVDHQHSVELGERGHRQALEQSAAGTAGQIAVEKSKPKPQQKGDTKA